MSVRKKQIIWVVIAILFILIAAVTMWTDETKRNDVERIEFPTHMRNAELTRQRNRAQQLSLLLSNKLAEGPVKEEADPFMVALSAAARGGTFMVFELKKLMETPVGEIITGCLERSERNPFDKIEEETGVSILNDLGRLAMSENMILFEGFFPFDENAPISEGFESTVQGSAVRYTRTEADSGFGDFAIWDQSVLILGKGSEPVDSALGMLSGEIPYDPSALSSIQTYGDIYGNLDVDDAADLFENEGDMAQRIVDLVDSVEVHVDASEDVAMVATMAGSGQEEMSDLAKSLGSVLSLARFKAQMDDEEDLAELLDYASVSPSGEQFDMKLALPLEYLERHLADCKWMGEDAPEEEDPRMKSLGETPAVTEQDAVINGETVP
jgi:hypothetical protein